MQDNAENDVTISSLWTEINDKLRSIEMDVAKSSRGVVAAGPRVRQVLRSLKTDLSGLVKLTLAQEKAVQAARKARKTEKAQ